MATTIEYFEIWMKYRNKYNNNEDYNDRVLLLMQIGSFYELYEYDPEQCNDEQQKCSSHRPGVVFNQRMGSALAVADVIDLKIKQWYKEKPYSIHNPYKGGFPCVAYERKRPYLTREGFIIIRVDQYNENGVIKRKVVEEETPGTAINDIEPSILSNNIASIYILHQTGTSNRKMVVTCGVSTVDIITGTNIVSEMYSQQDDSLYAVREINRMLLALKPKEILLTISCVPEARRKSYANFLLDNLPLDGNKINVIWNWDNIDTELTKLSYQQSFFDKIFYRNHSSTNNPDSSSIAASSTVASAASSSSSDMLEYLGLDELEFARLSYILLLQYCFSINSKIVEKLQKPIINWLDQDKHLILTNNALQQLDVTHGEYRYSRRAKIGSLFDVINYTSTRLGHRMLYQRLVNPITDVVLLNESYNQIHECLQPEEKPIVDELDKLLRGIPDISRLQRLLDLQIIKPPEMAKLYQGYLQTIDVYMFIYNSQNEYLKKLLVSSQHIGNFNSFFQYIYSVLIVENDKNLNMLENSTIVQENGKNLLRISGGRHPFRRGLNTSLDNIYDTINTSRQYLEQICQHLNTILARSKGKLLSIEETSDYTNEGLLTTQAKASALIKAQESGQVNYEICGVLSLHSVTKNNKAVTSPIIEHLCGNLIKLQLDYEQQLYATYQYVIEQISIHFTFGLPIARMIASVDFIKSGARLALKHKYYMPTIEGDGSKSFLHVRELRHPIVEVNIPVPYVANDISLSHKQNGYLLYGANSTGKSTLTKSIGLMLILAQAGYYVPGHLVYYPFSRIITRLSGHDDLLKNKSSFMIEMDELAIILRYSDSRTLVLGDELCRGTETSSGTALTVTCLEELISRNSMFVFSTHMHHLVHIPEVKNMSDKLYIGHLDIGYDVVSGDLRITRKLCNGAGNTAYGIEIAKSLGIEANIIQRSTELRQKLFEQEELLPTQTSKYNSSLYIDSCAMCGSKKNLHSHHIQPQKSADSQGFINNMHKNIRSNLLVLCVACHQRVHQEGISFRVDQLPSGYQIRPEIEAGTSK